MDSFSPTGIKNKQTLWQKLTSLPLKIKIAILLLAMILLAGVAVLVWAFMPKSAPESPITNGPSKQQSEQKSNGASDSPPKTEEQKKEEEAKNTSPNPPVSNNNPTGSGSTGNNPPQPGGTTPPPTSPPPSGSTRPSTTTTGPSGALTSTYNGATSNGNSNQTFQNMDFPAPGSPGYYIFSGNNLTFRNCHIHGGGLLIQGDSITIENCIIEGGISLSGTNGVTFQYNEIYNFNGDGIHLTSDSGQAANVTIAHSYIHGPTPTCGDHADGIQIRGVNTLTLFNNNFDMGPWLQVCGQDALNAAIFFESANGGNSNLTVDSNYLNGAGITLRLNPGSNQKIINNRFGRDYEYGLVSNQTTGGNITQQSGNVMDDDGSPVNF